MFEHLVENSSLDFPRPRCGAQLRKSGYKKHTYTYAFSSKTTFSRKFNLKTRLFESSIGFFLSRSRVRTSSIFLQPFEYFSKCTQDSRGDVDISRNGRTPTVRLLSSFEALASFKFLVASASIKTAGGNIQPAVTFVSS